MKIVYYRDFPVIRAVQDRAVQSAEIQYCDKGKHGKPSQGIQNFNCYLIGSQFAARVRLGAV